MSFICLFKICLKRFSHQVLLGDSKGVQLKNFQGPAILCCCGPVRRGTKRMQQPQPGGNHRRGYAQHPDMMQASGAPPPQQQPYGVSLMMRCSDLKDTTTFLLHMRISIISGTYLSEVMSLLIVFPFRTRIQAHFI